MIIFNPTDEELLSAVASTDGARTHHIAGRLGAPLATADVYRRMIRLEREGKVSRCPRYTYVNDIYWRVAS